MFFKSNKKASIMLVAVIISTSIITLFMTISYLSDSYKNQVSALEYGNLAENSAESAIEEAVVSYFKESEEAYKSYKESGDEKVRREAVLYPFVLESSEIKLSHASILDDLVGTVGITTVTASRLQDKIEIRVSPFSSYEFRLTAEEREDKDTWSQEQIKQLKVNWNKANGDPLDAGLEIIQIRWPLNQNGNIETHRLHFDNGGSFTFGDFGKMEKPEEATLSLPSDDFYATPSQDGDLETYEYIYIFRAKVFPILLSIEALNSEGNVIEIPDRNAYFTAKAVIGGEGELGGDNIGKTFTKELEMQKEIYTDFDSNFDYARNFVNY